MQQWLVPLSLILIGFLCGIISEKVILKKLRVFLAKTQLPGNEIFIEALRGMTIIWFIVAGFDAAVISLQISQLISVSIAGILHNILIVIFLYSITISLSRLATGFVTLWGQKTQGISASLLYNLTKITVFGLGILVILQTLGISITPILATLGIGGLAVALAFQETFANLFAGLYLIISQQVRSGDYVRLETGAEGYVEDITWRNTVIKEISNNVIIVPNTKFSSAIFTNYHLPAKEINVPIKLGVSYNSDLEKVEQVTLEVAKQIMQEIAPDISDFEPFILYDEFADNSINFTIFIRVDEFLNQRIAKHKLIKRLNQRYKQEKIEIPFKQLVVYLPKGNKNQRIN